MIRYRHTLIIVRMVNARPSRVTIIIVLCGCRYLTARRDQNFGISEKDRETTSITLKD